MEYVFGAVAVAALLSCGIVLIFTANAIVHIVAWLMGWDE